MNLTSPREIRALLQKYSARPVKGLGQRFLIDKKILRKIVEAANLKPENTVLEIGPGIGTLTQKLAQKAKRVIAVEKDRKMVEILKEILKDFKNVEIINKDILRLDPKPYTLKTYKIVANLPYYITSPVIRKFLESENPPKEMILMVQKEVAQRIAARPPKMSILAVSVQFYAKPEIISYVSKKSFWPSPKVDSAIIKIIPRRSAYGSASFCERFFRIVKAGFSQPRKQILNNLAEGLALSLPKGLKLNKERVKFWLGKNKIKPTQRAETLTIKDWINLIQSYKNFV